MKSLLITLRFHEGRYHGLDRFQRPEWPPAPARLFQALISGVAIGRRIAAEDQQTLLWLETLRPPLIAAPLAQRGQWFTTFVPTNERDKVEKGRHKSEKARLKALAGIRISKRSKPLLFDERIPLFYSWQFSDAPGTEQIAKSAGTMAERLYQLGRTIDLAYACGEVLAQEAVEERLANYPGRIYRPSDRSGGLSIAVPFNGALKQLIRVQCDPGSIKHKPQFPTARYNSPPHRFLFDLLSAQDAPEKSRRFAWPLAQAAQLVENVRNRAAQKLKKALPEKAATIERVFIGRNAAEADKAARIRIVPLPSIGSPHVARAIRRVLVEVPPDCPLAAEDIDWAFSGLDLNLDYETGEISDDAAPVLVAADDESMLRHYGIDDGSAGRRVWRTVTPAALPQQAARRRIDPRRLREELAAVRDNSNTAFKEVKPGRERLAEQHCAISAAVQAVRHAGVAARPETIRVQREPFEGRGARAEAFAPGTRFAKERLWHVEIAFAEPQRGPLAIGDGRYLGLGLMAPLRDVARDILAFAVPEAANIGAADGPALVRAARRALMALARDSDGCIPRLFSGHEPDGRPASSGRQEHIFLAADDDDGDGHIDRLIVAAPWTCDRSLLAKREMRKTFDEVVSRLEVVRAGRLGVITLGPPRSIADRDPLIGPARVWQSRTPYRATRHAGRRKDPAEALERDLVSECLRRGLPRPKIEILQFSAVPDGGGLLARARLHFASAIRGPLLLGRDSHQGGGLLRVEP